MFHDLGLGSGTALFRNEAHASLSKKQLKRRRENDPTKTRDTNERYIERLGWIAL